MKVMVLALVVEDNKIAGWRRSIEMPASPIGLDTISVECGDTGLFLKIQAVGWSESEGAFVVTTEPLVDGPKPADFSADKNWQPTHARMEIK